MNFAVLYCILWFFLMLQRQLTSVYLLHICSHFYPQVNEEMLFLNQFWGWLTSSVTFIMGNQVSLQIFMRWIDCSQRIIDLKNCLKNSKSFVLKNFDWEREKSLLLCSLSGKPCDLCQTKLMLWSFSSPSWFDLWTFWLLASMCSMPRGL